MLDLERTIGGLAILKAPFMGNEDAQEILDSAREYLKMQDADIKALSEKYSDLLDRMLEPITPYELEGDFWCGQGCTTVGRRSQLTNEIIKSYNYCPICGKEIEWND